MQLKIKAPAKINLALDILKRREDGYHDVEMVMQTVSLYDIIKVSIVDDYGIKVSCNKDISIENDKNTAYKAAKLLLDNSNIKNYGVEIDIEKNIPTEAGLAGGSTDAGAVLIALNQLLKTNYSLDELAKIGGDVGADVPFCLYGGTMFADGIGTNLKRIVDIPHCYFVLVKPDISISTKKAYEAADRVAYNNSKNVRNVVEAIYNSDLYRIGNTIFNKFEQVIDVEEIDNIKKLMYQNKALGACMSGSGSTVFAIFDDKSSALECIKQMKLHYNNVFLCEPIRYGCKVI